MAALAILLVLPGWLAAMQLLAYVTTDDAQSLAAIFRIASYAVVLWFPLTMIWVRNKSGMSRSLRTLAIAPVIAMAVISFTAGVLWWR